MLWSDVGCTGKLGRHGGVLSEEEQDRAVRLGMALLRHLHAWAPAWKPPAEGAEPSQADPLQEPDPPSSAQAVLLLLSRLTKRHPMALKVGSATFLAEYHQHALTWLQGFVSRLVCKIRR